MNSVMKGLLGLWMAGVVIALFLVVPQHAGLGNAGRIIILHVPTAWVSVVAFAVSAWYSARYLMRRQTADDDRALAAAESGFLFTILATITGAMFSQIIWGSYWNWDPRQTSIFVLLLIYGALFALRSALDDMEQRRRLGAVFSLFAFVTVPFLFFIVPRMAESTLHPNCTFLPGSNCDGVVLEVGKIGLLGDHKVQLLSLDRKGDVVRATIEVSEPGLASVAVLAPTFDHVQNIPHESPEFPGQRFRLMVDAVDMEQGRAHLNMEAPGTGILSNQRTLVTFVASLIGFTGLFVWMFQLRTILLGISWDLAQREGMLP